MVIQRCYIAGRMTGMPEFNRPAFNAAAAQLRTLGYHVENPAEIPPIPGDPWAAYMRLALTMMLKCDVVVLLPGWEGSKGATIEQRLAVDLGIPVITFPDFLNGTHA